MENKVEYYELILEYPKSPKLGTKVIVDCDLQIAQIIKKHYGYTPSYDDVINYPYFWKKYNGISR